MKKAAGFSIVIVILVSVIFYAQPRRTPEERAKLLKNQLNLTEEQTAKVDSLYTLADTKLNDASQNGFDRTKFRTIMESTNEQIEKILTDDQKDAFKKIIEERRNRMQGNRRSK